MTNVIVFNDTPVKRKENHVICGHPFSKTVSLSLFSATDPTNKYIYNFSCFGIQQFTAPKVRWVFSGVRDK